MTLPTVSRETIEQVIANMELDKDSLFKHMAIDNPYLFQFIYGMYQLPECDKEMMLGVAIGIYHMLEMQVQKRKEANGQAESITES